MTETQARTFLRRMLRSFTAGSILHLLGDIMAGLSENALRDGDDAQVEQLSMARSALFVVGLGIDAAWPRQP